MEDDVFDLTGLADLLHKPLGEVQKLVERGRIPGRRVQGGWRFHKQEISDWITTQIGNSGTEELLAMEQVLEHPKGRQPLEPVPLTELLAPDRMAIPLLARTRGKVISAMVALPVNTGLVWDAAAFEQAVQEREELLSTATETGVALLHPRRPLPQLLGDNFLALGITPGGIPFGGSHGRLTDIFFLIGALDDRWHLRVLAKLSRLAMQPAALEALRASSDVREALQVIEQFDAGGSGN